MWIFFPFFGAGNKNYPKTPNLNLESVSKLEQIGSKKYSFCTQLFFNGPLCSYQWPVLYYVQALKKYFPEYLQIEAQVISIQPLRGSIPRLSPSL